MRIFWFLLSTAFAEPGTFLDQLDAPNQKIRESAWDELEKALNAGPPGPVAVNRHAESIKRVWSKLKPKLSALKPTTCKDEKEESSALRAQAELILDLYGSLKGGVPELQEAARLAEPRLAFFALRSLGRQKAPLDREAIDRVAKSDEMRKQLYDFLKTEKLPTANFSREDLARSAMVAWLIYPTELGCVPDEIVLGKKISDFFVFKFRGKDGKWLAGVTGPGDRRTFSKFEAWDSRTPEQHLESIAGSIAEWEIKNK